MEAPEISASVRQILLEGVLRGTNPTLLQDSTPLLSGGVLDSVRMVTLISDLERAFGVSFEAFEMSVDYLDSIAIIARTIRDKQTG
jgi:acyl carrier protein